MRLANNVRSGFTRLSRGASRRGALSRSLANGQEASPSQDGCAAKVSATQRDSQLFFFVLLHHRALATDSICVISLLGVMASPGVPASPTNRPTHLLRSHVHASLGQDPHGSRRLEDRASDPARKPGNDSGVADRPPADAVLCSRHLQMQCLAPADGPWDFPASPGFPAPPVIQSRLGECSIPPNELPATASCSHRVLRRVWRMTVFRRVPWSNAVAGWRSDRTKNI